MSTTISLGFEVPDYSGGLSPSNPEKNQKTKTAYPSMTIPGNKGLARALKPGQTIKATVEFNVCEVAIRDRKDDKDDGPVDQYGGTRVELEAQSITFDSLKVPEDEGMDGATAFQKYLKNKNGSASDDDGDEE